MKNVDTDSIRGKHSKTAISWLDPSDPGCAGSQLYLDMDKVIVCNEMMGSDRPVAERVAAISDVHGSIRDDIADCKTAISSVIFNSPLNERKSKSITDRRSENAAARRGVRSF
ncbi:hypothetical protein GCM10027289_08020 [Tsukamurella serpentis]